MDQMQFLQDVLRMLRRRAILIAFVCVTGVLAAAFFAFTLPPRYQASARILVESQKIPDELARSTVTSSAQERLRLIQERLMARDNVAALIEKLHLYADRPEMTENEKISALREATIIHNETFGQTGFGQPAGSSVVAIQVSHGDPEEAATIANEFVAALLAQNLEARAAQTRETLRFFDDERNRLADEISALDHEITSFKTANEALLPESVEFRHNEMGRLLDSSLEIDRRIQAIEDQRAALQSGLADDDAAGSLSPEAALLRQLETELVQKQQKLAPTHPEIQDLRGRIAAIRSVLGEDRTQASGAPAQSARARSIQRQVDLLDSQIVLLEEQRRQIADRREQIQTSLQATPQVETTLSKLERRRDALLEQYAVIVRKRTEAETGERLEETQQAERFEVIERALPPDRPIAPSRKKILVLGAGASFGLAMGLALLLEMLNPALRSTSQFQRQLEIAPLASIPYVRTRSERMRRTAILALAALFVAIALPAGLWAIDRHIQPIQSILERVVGHALPSGLFPSIHSWAIQAPLPDEEDGASPLGSGGVARTKA